MKLALIGKGSGKVLFKFPLRPYARASSASDQVAHFVILPFMHIVKGALQNLALRRIASVIQNNDNRSLPVAHAAGQLCPGHLKGAVSHQDDGPQAGVG